MHKPSGRQLLFNWQLVLRARLEALIVSRTCKSTIGLQAANCSVPS